MTLRSLGSRAMCFRRVASMDHTNARMARAHHRESLRGGPSSTDRPSMFMIFETQSDQYPGPLFGLGESRTLLAVPLLREGIPLVLS